MSAFTEIRDWAVRQGSSYITTKQVAWEIGRKGSGLWLRVPAGFVFNMSIPYPLRWLWSPHDPRYLKAAALHDFALADGWDRVSAAAAFSEALKASGVSWFTRLVMVLGVIVFKFN